MCALYGIPSSNTTPPTPHRRSYRIDLLIHYAFCFHVNFNVVEIYGPIAIGARINDDGTVPEFGKWPIPKIHSDT